jgi:hypothetical protein
MGKDPAVLFYTSDFISGTLTMTDEQRGKYILLLCLQHQKGVLTKRDMMNICKTYDKDVFCKFEIDKDGNLFNKRMLEESEKRKEYSKSRSLNRSHKKTYVEHMENENENISLSTNIEEEKMKIDLEQHLLHCWGRDGNVSALIKTKLIDLMKIYSRDKVLWAIEEAAKHNAKNLAYVTGILEKHGNKKNDSKSGSMENAFATQEALRKKEELRKSQSK